ncbi:MAG: FADH(2)-oxidizing methylenetetrahydrofolate--tRNA-(uracil(54)-C(5))-methyltransferase TrmFO, partial [Mesorhizobium sp.]
FPPVEAPKSEGKRLRGKDKTVAKRRAITARALADCRVWLGLPSQAQAAE